jgi:hypothetical protein
MELMKMIARRMRKGNAAPTIHPKAAIALMREFARAYAAGNVFKVNDLVTPRKWSDMKGPGNPHIVVEVADAPIRVFQGSPFGSTFGNRQDIRVISVMDGDVTPFWAESWAFEPYTGEGA